jgi:hypothetical protein
LEQDVDFRIEVGGMECMLHPPYPAQIMGIAIREHLGVTTCFPLGCPRHVVSAVIEHFGGIAGHGGREPRRSREAHRPEFHFERRTHGGGQHIAAGLQRRLVRWLGQDQGKVV